MSVPQDHRATRPAAEPGSSALRPDTVYRLRGIPERFQRSDIPGLLREAFGENDEFPVEVGSLAQSPHRAGEKVATVTLPEAGRVLPGINTNRDNKAEWPLSLDLREEGIVGLRLDTHFHGFTPLHDGEDAGCTRDIIAISGLNGHAFGSFKQRGGPWMWLRDGLPRDLPNTRIFTYGYDTQLQGSLSIQNLTDVGISLRAALSDFFQITNTNFRPRPLLFVGHSLGGLVVKEAFLHMKDPMYAKIIEATYGFLFFGVPNYGMAIESLVPMVRDQPNRSLLETLGRNSALLRCHQEQFSAIFMSNTVQIIGFYETKLSRTACDVNGVWKMQGPEALLVDFASATIGSNQYHPIDRNHSDMVKFNNVDDSNYRAIISYVRQLNYGSSSLMRGSTAPLSKDDKECLSSLAFPGQDWHKDGVVSVDGTCDWIFSHDIFKDWDTDPRQLLWIRGNPGTGKSTMMKHIFHFLGERKPQGQTLATFFFNGRAGGNKHLTTLLSLYRALLNQILHQSPEHLPELTTKFKAYKETQGKSWEWSVDELRRHFAKVAPAISAKRHICILVDALDEAGEEKARELIGQFQETLAAVNEVGGVLKICFSCRHYPILTLEHGLTVTMETENQEDIATFVRKRLKPFKSGAIDLEKAILQKAEGVFQWADLVTNQALELQRKGKKVKILEEIQRIPRQLEALYESLLSCSDQDEGQENQRQALELFQWTLFAVRPFTLAQARCVLDIDEQMRDTPIEEYLEDLRSMEDEDRVRRAVRTLSRGLVEFHLQKHWAYDKKVYALQPIHQTVREYLVKKGLRQLQGSAVGCPLSDPHYLIFKTSVKILSLEGVLKKPLAQDGDLSQILVYSLAYLGYHFFEADQKEVNPEELLDLFQWPSESQTLNEWSQYCSEMANNSIMEYPYVSFPYDNSNDLESPFYWPVNTDSTLLHLAAFVGNTGILASAIKRDNGHYLHAEDGKGWTPLFIAAGCGHEEFAIQILSRNQVFEIKAIDIFEEGDMTTITREAARKGLNRTLEHLLELGADVDGPKDIRPTPLFGAAYEGQSERQIETCRILLNHQADPEISHDDMGTPLSVAILKYNKELCRLLVQNRDEEPSSSASPTRANVYNALWPSSSYAKYCEWPYHDDCWDDEHHYADTVFRSISSQQHGDFIREVLGPISTPLHDACARGNIEVASFLIDKAGFDVNGKDDAGRTPIFRAVQEEQHYMIEWLFQNNGVHYLSRDDWSQLPGNTVVRGTYQRTVEKWWCVAGLSLSQRQEDPKLEQYRQWALEAFEDSQYCLEADVGDGSSLQQSVEFERNVSSFPPTTCDNHEERSSKRRRIDGGEEF